MNHAPPTPPATDQRHTTRGLVLIGGYAILTLSPLLIVLALNPATDHGFWTEWAKVLALIAVPVLALQFILAARLAWLTRPFGLDIVMRFHRAMGIAAVGLLLVHPLMLALDSIGLLTRWNQPLPIQLGRLALVTLLLLVVLSVFRRAMWIKFEWWRIGHDALALTVLFLAFVHSGFTGGDFENTTARFIWLAIPLPILALFLWHRFVRPWRLRSSAFTVRTVEQQAPGVWSVVLDPPEGHKPPAHLPGQFCFVTFHRGRGLPEEEHHWTISSSPTEPDALAFTIKHSGDFTSTIGETKPGDRATVHGPFGRFTHAAHPNQNDLVFIAAGIGITPLRSMIRHLHDTDHQRQVLLIYGNRKEDDIVFRDELQQIADRKAFPLRIVHTLTQPDDQWDGERGRIGIEIIEKHCEDELKNKSFWLCGPEPMRRQLIHDLRERGIPASHIHAEAFNLADGRTPRDGRGQRMRQVVISMIVLWLAVSLGAALLRSSLSSGGDSHQHEHQHSRRNPSFILVEPITASLRTGSMTTPFKPRSQQAKQ